MAIEVELLYKQTGYSENGRGRPESHEIQYQVRGADSVHAAAAAVRAEAPPVVLGMTRNAVEQREDHGNGCYTFCATYRKSDNPRVAMSWGGAGGSSNGAPVARINYDISGGNATMYYARDTVYSTPGAPEDPYGAINVDKDGTVNGVSVPTTESSFSETHIFAERAVGGQYFRMLIGARGKINSKRFRYWQPGEIRFDGATIANREDADGVWWEITYRFSLSLNATVNLGGRWPVLKEGWEIGWVCYKEKHDPITNTMISYPTYGRIQRVLEYMDFGAFKIGT